MDPNICWKATCGAEQVQCCPVTGSSFHLQPLNPRTYEVTFTTQDDQTVAVLGVTLKLNGGEVQTVRFKFQSEERTETTIDSDEEKTICFPRPQVGKKLTCIVELNTGNPSLDIIKIIACRLCAGIIKKLPSHRDHILVLREQLDHKVITNCAHEFLVVVNALLNEKGGYIIVHAECPNFLGDFDDKVDDTLSKLIPDSSCFHDVYHRHLADEKHVVFFVNPARSGNRPISTLKHHTKVPLDKGVIHPTQIQMQRLVQIASDPTHYDSEKSGEEDDSDNNVEKYEDVTYCKHLDPVSLEAEGRKMVKDGKKFIKREQNKIKRGKDLITRGMMERKKSLNTSDSGTKGHNESGSKTSTGEVDNGRPAEIETHKNETHAAEVMDDSRPDITDTHKNETNPDEAEGASDGQQTSINARNNDQIRGGDKHYTFVRNAEVKVNGLPLQESVSVQAKDIKTPPMQELRIPDHARDTRIEEIVKHIWNSFHLPGYISAFTKCKDGGSFYLGVEEIKGKKFICRGFRFSQKERSEMESIILKLAKEDMVWIGLFLYPGPVSVVFHDILTEAVEEQYTDLEEKDWCVVEIRVKPIHGICFYKMEKTETKKKVNNQQERKSEAGVAGEMRASEVNRETSKGKRHNGASNMEAGAKMAEGGNKRGKKERSSKSQETAAHSMGKGRAVRGQDKEESEQKSASTKGDTEAETVQEDIGIKEGNAECTEGREATEGKTAAKESTVTEGGVADGTMTVTQPEDKNRGSKAADRGSIAEGETKAEAEIAEATASPGRAKQQCEDSKMTSDEDGFQEGENQPQTEGEGTRKYETETLIAKSETQKENKQETNRQEKDDSKMEAGLKTDYIVPVAYCYPRGADRPERIPLSKWVVGNGGSEYLTLQKPEFKPSHSQ